MKIYTIGHGNRTVEHVIELLKEQGIGGLVDVRSHPGAKRFPRFGKTKLEQALNRAGLHYVWEGAALGEWHPELPGASRHQALKTGFRSFATHMETPDFRVGIERLLECARTQRTALFGAEQNPSRCHRALIADYLKVRGYEVRHILAPGEIRHHILHPAAWLEGHSLIYAPRLGMPNPLAASTARPPDIPKDFRASGKPLA